MFHDVPGILLLMPAFALAVMLIVLSSSRARGKHVAEEGDTLYRSQYHQDERKRRHKSEAASESQQGSADKQEEKRVA